TLSKFVLTVILLGILSIMTEPVHAGDIEEPPEYRPEQFYDYLPEYHPRFGAIALDDDVRAAIQKFPDVVSCLKPDAIKNGEPDFDAIDWHKIRNDGDAKVCLFMIFEQLGGPEPVKAWLGRMKLKPFGPGQTVQLSPSEARYFGYEGAIADQPCIGMSALWSLEGQYPIFPTYGIRRYIRRVESTGQTFGVRWFPDGKLMDVSVSYNSIFN
ncbi:MAG: hypothetical protein NUV50_00065, partial [Rhodospirillales bacterium]|nr:hypothetical protein [Rhodospirillales bacterium]